MRKITRRSFGAGLGAIAGTAAARDSEARIGMAFHGGAAGQSSTGIGYSVVITMDIGGAVYTFDPDTPDSHTTVDNQGNFVSDFAGFVQGSVMCSRDDTPVPGSLRVYFRKDVTPNPARIEIIVELGKLTTGNIAANLGAFTLQILKAGVPQAVPYATVANQAGTSTAPHFPSLGWFTRWRWNPTPRPEVRSRASLLPAALNLLPNFSASLATTFRAQNCGTSLGPSENNHYSSAYTTQFPSSFFPVPNDLNPVGVNECCGITGQIGGVGGRPELGVTTEWQANYVVNGNVPAQTAMYTLGEVAGGMPWCARDQATGAPPSLLAHPTWSWGTNGLFDSPLVSIPSGGGGGVWGLEVHHTPPLSSVSYILTGDPFYLENVQFAANFAAAVNSFHREVGFKVNYADYFNSIDAFTPNIPLLPSYRLQTRGLAWGVREWAMAYLATPASTPSWLLPKSYWDTGLSQNATYADRFGTNYNANFPTSPQYPDLELQGQMPASADYEVLFYLAYFALGCGFAVTQAGRSEWLSYFTYLMKSAIAMSNGTSGWDNRWPSPYVFFITPVSTDYDASPARLSDWSKMWAFNLNNAILADFPLPWTIGQGSNGMTPLGHAWMASTPYTCNCWICEVRSGIPSLPFAGETVSFTISGPFAGSPVTVSHTITNSDVTIMSNWTLNDVVVGGGHPIVDPLIAAINANSALATAGITASATTSTGFQNIPVNGRMFINFNSGTVNPIAITGSWTTSSAGSIFIQPNGDCVYKGNATSALFGRPISYQCAKTGTSGLVGPSGTAFNTAVADGSTAWCFAPEEKSWPVTTPGTGNSAPLPFPRILQNFRNPQPIYVTWAWTGMTMAAIAGIPGAAACMANLRAEIDDWFTNVDPTLSNQFNFSIALEVAVPVVAVVPSSPSIPSSTPKGATVATITVTMSDGSPFTGTIGFGAPNFGNGGIYSLSGSGASRLLLVSPSGPGVGAEGGNVDHVTVVANQP